MIFNVLTLTVFSTLNFGETNLKLFCIFLGESNYFLISGNRNLVELMYYFQSNDLIISKNDCNLILCPGNILKFYKSN